VRESLVQILRCPSCAAEGAWAIVVAEERAREIREAELRCKGCGQRTEVHHGIVDLLNDPPDFVIREAAGLGQFAKVMRNDGWDRSRVLQLPYVEIGYWYPQAIRMQQLLDSPEAAWLLEPGRRVLDVGSNTCWASAIFAERGMDVVALDICRHQLQGLETADWWIQDRNVYFERVLGVMYDTPFAAESFDAIFCSEVLHHNHPANLDRTLVEFKRILKPGGQVLAINEPVRAVCSPKLRPKAGPVAAFKGHEHAYLRRTYVRAARAAGLHVEVGEPRDVGALGTGTWGIAPETPGQVGVRMALGHLIRRSPRLRRPYLAWKTYVSGASLYMTATKPRFPA
jgi:SAM-dependent methyltransferase/uncharacterized protein YbaR (Trm112 family)